MTALAEPFDPLPMARRIAALARERRASDAVLLDVRSLVDYTDFFLIVSGQSSRQNLAIAEHIVKTLKGEKRYALSKSGLDSGSWVCLDLGSVVVHVFDPETRARYDLELLWADAPRVDVDEPKATEAVAPAADAESASEPAPKKGRRRAVRKAAVEDADAENAPDSARPPLDEPEPESAAPTPSTDEKPAASRKRKSTAPRGAKPADKANKPAASPPAKRSTKPAAKKPASAPKRAKPAPRKKPSRDD